MLLLLLFIKNISIFISFNIAQFYFSYICLIINFKTKLILLWLLLLLCNKNDSRLQNKKGFAEFHARVFSLDDASHRVDQLRLTVNLLRHWEQSTSYHVGDSWHTQNIQINNVIGENESCVFSFMEKLNGLFGQPNSFKCVINLNIWFI